MNLLFSSSIEISFNYFRNLEIATFRPTMCPRHFTDLLRHSLISSSKLHVGTPNEWKEIKHLYSASQLSETGIEFEENPNKDLLDLTYLDGMFIMSILNINDYT